MKRRDFLKMFGAVGAATVVPESLAKQLDTSEIEQVRQTPEILAEYKTSEGVQPEALLDDSYGAPYLHSSGKNLKIYIADAKGRYVLLHNVINNTLIYKINTLQVESFGSPGRYLIENRTTTEVELETVLDPKIDSLFLNAQMCREPITFRLVHAEENGTSTVEEFKAYVIKRAIAPHIALHSDNTTTADYLLRSINT